MSVKSLFLLVFTLLFVYSSDMYSQSFLKKLNEKLKNVEKTMEDVNDILGGTKTSTENTSSNDESIDMSVDAFVGEVETESRSTAFKMTTNHPDFKIKVRRCEVSGQTCVIDLILENVGSSDVLIRELPRVIAYDDEANEYTNIRVSVGSTNWVGDFEPRTLLSEVPMKARIQIEGVKEAATMFRRLDWKIESSAWGLGRNKFVTFRNLPISREGDGF